MTTIKCDHCDKTCETPLRLFGKIHQKSEHDFCSVRCVVLWAKSLEAVVPNPVPPIQLANEQTVDALAAILDVRPFQVIGALMEENNFSTRESLVKRGMAEKVCKKLGKEYASV